MMIPSMSRSPVPLLVAVGLALAASASPLVAQKGDTIARGAPKASASQSAHSAKRYGVSDCKSSISPPKSSNPMTTWTRRDG